MTTMTRIRIFQRPLWALIGLAYLVPCMTFGATMSAQAQDNQPSAITLERGVAVRMRDGVTPTFGVQ
jgi:hypothetical protein